MGRPNKFIWPDVPPGGDDCWLWDGTTDVGGYGKFVRNGKAIRAHRHSYALYVGSIPKGMSIDHACHNAAVQAGTCSGGNACVHRRCINPRHLRIATAEMNVRAALPPICSTCGGPKERRVLCRPCNAQRARERTRKRRASGTSEKRGACPVCGSDLVARYIRDHIQRVHPTGHLVPPRAGGVQKLTDESVREARQALDAGAAVKATAEKYGVSRGYMNDIKNRLVRREA